MGTDPKMLTTRVCTFPPKPPRKITAVKTKTGFTLLELATVIWRGFFHILIGLVAQQQSEVACNV
jgi:hypothetical protein